MGSSSRSSSSNDVRNADNRMALQDSVNVGAGATATIYAADAEVLRTLAGTLPDAAVAMTHAGADVIERAGGSIVNMNRDSIEANRQSFDSVVSFGADAIDRIIDASVETSKAGNALASQAVSSFKPTENANADALKWGLLAAAGVAGAIILKGAK